MSKSKLTLIVDGNWLLMSRLSVINNKFNDDYELCQELQLLMSKSINVVLKTFPNIDNIIFCADGGSWRNNIEIPKFMHHDIEGVNVEYKGTRIKSPDINWTLIYESFEEFMGILNQNGITTCKEKNIEGDDWCYHWSTYLNQNGTNCIIWTNDNDLKQLVSMNENKCFTAWYNSKNGLFLKEYDDDDFNFLFNIEFNENEIILNDIIKHVKNINKINPKNIIIDKIIRGDAGDNIYPIITRNSKNNSGRIFKVTPKDINYELDYNNITDIKQYIYNLINSKNYVGRINEKYENIIEHFKYNKILVVLEQKSYPKEILDILNNYHEYSISTNIKSVENQIQAMSNKLNGILDII